jgi:LacI family transcriptional regulator
MRLRSGTAAAVIGSAFHGYFCGNDVLAFGTIKALEEHGLSVPHDIAVSGLTT